MTKLKCLLLLAACLAFAWQASGAPSITSVTGTVTDGDTLTIVGSGFGAHELNIAWIGGINGPIQTDTLGSRAEYLDGTQYWFSSAAAGYNCEVKTAAERARPNRIRSLRGCRGSSCTGSNCLNADLVYGPRDENSYTRYTPDTTFAFSEIYATTWVYYEPKSGQGQWKFFRISTRPTYSPSDYPGTFLYSGTDGVLGRTAVNPVAMCSCVNNTQAACGITCSLYGYPTVQTCIGPGVGASAYSGPNDANAWSRHEWYTLANTEVGSNNGASWWKITVPGRPNSPHVAFNDVIVTTHDSSYTWETGIECEDAPGTFLGETPTWFEWIRAGFQNYIGNAQTPPGTTLDAEWHFDDIYLQFGDRAHLEVGNASAYTSCTQTEIQVPTAWTDTLITMQFNLGGFSLTGNDCLYAFVVDSLGVASPGYKIANPCVPCCPDSCKPDCTAACIDAAQ